MDNKNLILAVVLSTLIMVGFQWYYGTQVAPPQTSNVPAQQIPSSAPQEQPTVPGGAPSAQLPNPVSGPVPGAAPGAQALMQDAQAVANAPRVTIESPRLSGTINLIGARFDDLTLKNYRETVDPTSPQIRLLLPVGGANPYYAQFGWVAGAGNGTQAADIPQADARWTADKTTLTPESPVTLTWTSPNGVRYALTVSLDANFMFTVTQKVENTGANPVSVHPYGRLRRTGTPHTTDFYILHEGLLGVFDGVLQEVSYSDVREAKDKVMTRSSTGGWIGITDKYWLTALAPDQNTKVNTRFADFSANNVDHYQADFLESQVDVAPGGSSETTGRLFAGAKEAPLITGYRDELNISRFDLAIDWGWFEFLTKPLLWALLYINGYVGNMGVAILLVTVVLKLLFFPLANTSYKAMAKMKEVQPEMMKLRERFGDDKARLNQEMMNLYKTRKVNPASGCLPILPQIPVFFALYKVLFVTIEMRHAPFFGWVHDLSAPDDFTFVNLFGLIDWTPPDFLILGIWPIIMGVTMYMQQKLNPPPPDPIQAKIFNFLPVIFTIMLARFPVGLVIYWAWNNSLSILQQYVIMRRMGVPIGGGKTPTAANTNKT